MNPLTLPRYLELLDPKRREVFAKLAAFRNLGVLAGGTALMLQIGHRQSFDFDIFLSQELPDRLLLQVNRIFTDCLIVPSVDNKDNLTLTIDNVVVTFFYHPFPPLYPPVATQALSLTSVADVASNKAYTIGRRPAWRDYVDMYFLLRDHSALAKIIVEAQRRFGGNFSEKLFLEQLTYFGDVTDYSVELMDKGITNEQIKAFLEQKVKEYLTTMPPS